MLMNYHLLILKKNIKEISEKARDGKLTIEDLQGGTFTISNGGVYGSMLSTPILNLPQSGVLGMHNIVERPVVVDGEIKIRPIMYLALSYDHRIIDGKESVSFLKMVKENLEDPRRLFFGYLNVRKISSSSNWRGSRWICLCY
jgi:2-oxoglutarate dehydrogenase E2 component (dihydrolipoamide succinyltransferase)